MRDMPVSVLCVIQARMGSKRLPGKMLLPVGGVPLIEIAWRKACEAFGEENVVVALSEWDCYGPLAEELRRIGAYFTGVEDEDDVLGRFYTTAELCAPDTIIFRYTPDDWRKDVDAMRRVAAGEKGIPVEIGGEAFTFAQLKEAHETVTDPFMREHITYALKLSAPPPPDDGLPWSIDTETDYRRACESVMVKA